MTRRWQAVSELDAEAWLLGVPTPYEKLKALPNAASHLNDSIDFEQLDAAAYKISDNEAARQLGDATANPFKSVNQARTSAA